MIYKTFNGGMSRVRRVSSQMRDALSDATGNDKAGFWFRVGRNHYYATSRDPDDTTPHVSDGAST